jgi:hypothetical protein
MKTQVQVIFYSLYGHVHRLARAVAAGAVEVAETEVRLLQVSELMSDEALAKSGAKESRQAFCRHRRIFAMGQGLMGRQVADLRLLDLRMKR